MSDYDKPLPDITIPLTAPFWEGTREERLMLQRCPACQYRRWPPLPICPGCHLAGGIWEEISPTGTLWSFATYHRALDSAFAADVPYTVGLVTLDAGPAMYGIIRAETPHLGVGARVHALFEAVTPEVTFVRWKIRP